MTATGAQSAEPAGQQVTYQQLTELVEVLEAQDDHGTVVRADITGQEITVHLTSPSHLHGEIVSEAVFQVRSQGRDAVALVENRVHRPDLGYVIVDPRDGTIAVHSGPDTSAGEPRYADTPRHYKFGETVPMGAWSVDTGGFPRYRS
ncbi:hypothetical protein [Streptomyces sp. NPDC020607]|uniref:hypothetical protein n=1 Tax=Streptomyces sp. NPDC020607 TaxID=3365082 RepID=UPI0037973FE6